MVFAPYWKGTFKCIGACDIVLVAVLKCQPIFNQNVLIEVNLTTSSTSHDLINKTIRCSGPQRKEIALELTSTSISNRLAQYTIDNFKNETKNCNYFLFFIFYLHFFVSFL